MKVHVEDWARAEMFMGSRIAVWMVVAGSLAVSLASDAVQVAHFELLYALITLLVPVVLLASIIALDRRTAKRHRQLDRGAGERKLRAVTQGFERDNSGTLGALGRHSTASPHRGEGN